MRTSYPLRGFAELPVLGALPGSSQRLAAALRLWGVMLRLGGNCLDPVAEKLGSRRAAAHFLLLMEEVVAAWPDPFCLSPPCAPRLSHDEVTFVAMIAAAAAGDRPSFDRLLAELLGVDERERLFFSAALLSRTLPA